MAPKVNVISPDNGKGLSQDIFVIRSALEEQGFDVSVTDVVRRKSSTGRRMWLPKVPVPATRFDISLMLEVMAPDLIGSATHNLYMPNPEWLSDFARERIPMFDLVLAKTRSGERLLGGLGAPTAYVGFTSVAYVDEGVARERAFFHLAGSSPLKGTDRLIESWRRNPAWPALTVVQSASADRPVVAENIVFRSDVPREQLTRLQNSHLFHLCPSEAEGWGHYIVEALAVGAIVVTTDAPPMNELVDDTCGLLVPASDSTERVGLTTARRFSESRLAAAVERCLAMSAEEVEALSERARQWYVANDRAFAPRLARVLEQVLEGKVSRFESRVAGS